MGKIKDKLARASVKYDWIPDGEIPNFAILNDSDEEILKSGKTTGHKAKSMRKNFIGAGILGGGTIGYQSTKKAGLKMTGSVLGAGIGAVTGGVLGNALAKSWQKDTVKKHGTKEGRRSLDNYKVARNEMTEEEFDRKWKKK